MVTEEFVQRTRRGVGHGLEVQRPPCDAVESLDKRSDAVVILESPWKLSTQVK